MYEASRYLTREILAYKKDLYSEQNFVKLDYNIV